jgi:hypothetical protein
MAYKLLTNPFEGKQKRFLSFCVLILTTAIVSAQTRFAGEGRFSMTLNSGEKQQSLLLNGRLFLNDFISSSLGLGLWNSGYQDEWKESDENSLTIFKLKDGKALPTIQFGVQAQIPLLKINQHPLKFFIEPYTVFLPFSGRTSKVEELYYTKDLVASSAAGEDIYNYTDSKSFSYKSDSNPRLYYGLQAGFTTILKDQLNIGLGLGYTSLDLFKDLRGQTLHTIPLDKHLPREGMMTLSLTLNYSVPTN